MSSQKVLAEKITTLAYGSSYEVDHRSRQKSNADRWKQPTPIIAASTRPTRLPKLLKCVFVVLLLLRLCFFPGFYLYQNRHRHHAVPPLDPAFLAQCDSLLAPAPSTFTDRLGRLVSVLKETDSQHPTVWIAEPGPSSSYFIGAFASSDWHLSERPFLVVITPAEDGVSPNITLLSPEFERLRAQLQPIPEQVEAYVKWLSWQEDESPYEVLVAHLGSVGGLVVDPLMRSFIGTGLGKAVEKAGNADDEAIASDKTAVALLRERKDEREIGLLRCANQVRNVLDAISPC